MKVLDILTESTKPVFKEDFPISLAAVKTDPQATGTMKRLPVAFELIQKALDADEVINTDLQSIKDKLNSFVEDAVKNVIAKKYYYGGAGDKLPDELNYMDYPYSLHLLPAWKKKLDKVSAESKKTAMWKDAMALIGELSPLVDIMAWMKTHTIMASVKKRQEMDVKKAEKEVYDKKFTDHKDVKKVKALLKKTADSIEHELYESILSGLQGIVETYKKQIKESGHTDYTKMYERNPYYKIVIQGLVEADHKAEEKAYGYRRKDQPRIFVFRKDWKKIIDNDSKHHASEIVNHFVNKNAEKVSFVLFTKNNLKSVEINNVRLSRGAVECNVDCVFEDGARFTADSQVVYAVSKLGKWFYRYPTLFKNVMLPDGKRMSGATEQKMDEVFAIAK